VYTHHVQNQFGPILHFESGVQPLQVRTHGGKRDPDVLGDLLVASAGKELPDHLLLPGRQLKSFVQRYPFSITKYRISFFIHRTPTNYY
jgi:hypothetical protein